MSSSEWNGGLTGQKVASASRTFFLSVCLLFRVSAFRCDEASSAGNHGRGRFSSQKRRVRSANSSPRPPRPVPRCQILAHYSNPECAPKAKVGTKGSRCVGCRASPRHVSVVTSRIRFIDSDDKRRNTWFLGGKSGIRNYITPGNCCTKSKLLPMSPCLP
jgi:hypothetical protein